jgi:hypothetical protein
MYCWSCGTKLRTPGRACQAGGADPPALRPRGEGDLSPEGAFSEPGRWSVPLLLRACPACGFRGDGIPYFRRAGNMALLAAATLFTYGVGGVIYWVLKRSDRVCPSCGLGWERARPLGAVPRGPADDPQTGVSRMGGGEAPPPGPGPHPPPGHHLPPSGVGRRVAGTLVVLVALLMVGLGITELEPVLMVVGGVTGATGALTFAWGWRALQRRREALLRAMQGKVLRLARAREGRLTATDVATELDLTLNAAERVLLSLDDGFRIRSDVTEEGILVFEFPELLLGPPEVGGRGGRRSVPGEPRPE